MSVGFRAGIHKIGHSAQARIGRQRRRTKSAWMTIAVVASRFAHSLRPSQKRSGSSARVCGPVDNRSHDGNHIYPPSICFGGQQA